jgi:hypothetical protein
VRLNSSSLTGERWRVEVVALTFGNVLIHLVLTFVPLLFNGGRYFSPWSSAPGPWGRASSVIGIFAICLVPIGLAALCLQGHPRGGGIALLITTAGSALSVLGHLFYVFGYRTFLLTHASIPISGTARTWVDVGLGLTGAGCLAGAGVIALRAGAGSLVPPMPRDVVAVPGDPHPPT